VNFEEFHNSSRRIYLRQKKWTTSFIVYLRDGRVARRRLDDYWMLLIVVVIVTLLFFVKLLSAQLLIKSCLILIKIIRQILQNM